MLDESLVGKSVYMRWQKYGRQLGRIYAKLPKDTPRLFNTFNYRVVWADKPKGPANGIMRVGVYLRKMSSVTLQSHEQATK